MSDLLCIGEWVHYSALDTPNQLCAMCVILCIGAGTGACDSQTGLLWGQRGTERELLELPE